MGVGVREIEIERERERERENGREGGERRDICSWEELLLDI